MIFPGQFHEIAAVSKKVEAQPPVKVDGTLDVLYDNLSYQLLCGVNVSAHSWLLSGRRPMPSRKLSLRLSPPPPNELGDRGGENQTNNRKLKIGNESPLPPLASNELFWYSRAKER